MKNFSFKFIIFIVCLFFLGCSNRSSNDVVEIIQINGEKYTTKDLWLFANSVLWEMEPKDLSNNSVKEKILEEFIEHKLLLQEAEYRNITINKDRFEQLFIHLSTEQGKKELRALTGYYEIKPDDVARLSEERVLVDELLRDVMSKKSEIISEEEIKAAYTAKNLPKTPVGEAHILHIFSTDEDKINEAAKELAKGLKFSEVASKYSESPEKTKGGDLGFVKEDVYPEFFKPAFKLKEGDVSEVIRSEYGYHIFKMIQHVKAGKNSYNSLKPALIAEIYADKREKIIGDFINEVYSKAEIKRLSDFLLTDVVSSNN